MCRKNSSGRYLRWMVLAAMLLVGCGKGDTGWQPAGTSRSAPLPFGTMLRFETWTVTPKQVVHGEEAERILLSDDPNSPYYHNRPAPEGYEYLLVTIYVESILTPSDPRVGCCAITLGVTGHRNVLYNRLEPMAITVAQPFLGIIPPGSSAEGQVVIAIPIDETGLLLSVKETTPAELPEQSIGQFVAIDEGAQIAPDPALQNIQATQDGMDLSAPVPLMTPITTDDWIVSIQEVIRGDEAARRITALNTIMRFPIEVSQNTQNVLVRFRARSISTANPDMVDGIARRFGLVSQRRSYGWGQFAPPNPSLEGGLFPGGEVEGWLAYNVAIDEQQLAVTFLSGRSMANKVHYLATEPAPGAPPVPTSTWVPPDKTIPTVTPILGPPPEVRFDGIVPNNGPASGGTVVTLTGDGFVPGKMSVIFGPSEFVEMTCESSTTCTAIVPPGKGPVNVVIYLDWPPANGHAILYNAFTYIEQ